MDHRLDISGTRCPVPLLMTARFTKELAPGERLLVIGDDPDMLVDLPRWCEESGNRLVEIRREGRRVHCVVEKAPASRAGPSPAPTIG